VENQTDKRRYNFKLITRNTISLLVGRTVSGLLQLFLFAVIARQLGVDKFGIFTLSLTIAGIVATVSDFGSCHLMIREVSKDKTKAGRYFINGTIVKAFLHFFIFGIFSLSILYLSNADYNNTILLACVSLIFAMFANFYISFFNAAEKMHFSALLSSLQSILVAIVCLSIILSGSRDVNYIFFGHISANFIVLVLSFVLVLKALSSRVLRIDPKFAFKFVKDSIPFGIFILGGMLYFQSDTIMLSIMKDQTAVGIYQAPMRLLLMLDLLPFLLSTAMYPTISRTFARSNNEAIIFATTSLKYLFLIGLPISFGICFFSDRIVVLIFGASFTQSTQVLRILSWIFPIRICCHILGTTLSAVNKQNQRALATGLSALLNILLNFILIPFYSYNGAAFASLLTCGFLALNYYVSIQKEFKIINKEYFLGLKHLFSKLR
jgi:O-antigen/teichoic acid export membrane protein